MVHPREPKTLHDGAHESMGSDFGLHVDGVPQTVSGEMRSSQGGTRPLDNDTRVALSKSMASILRHNAEKVGLKMRSDGYARVDDLVSAASLPVAL